MISVEGLVMPNKALTNMEILDAVRKLKIPRFCILRRKEGNHAGRHTRVGNLTNIHTKPGLPSWIGEY